jgi:hypothetical protein
MLVCNYYLKLCHGGRHGHGHGVVIVTRLPREVMTWQENVFHVGSIIFHVEE